MAPRYVGRSRFDYLIEVEDERRIHRLTRRDDARGVGRVALEAVFKRAERAGGLSTAMGDGNLLMGKIARRPWGEVSFYLHDPSGNPLCFVDEQSVYRG